MLTKRGRRVATVASQRGCISMSSLVASVNRCCGSKPGAQVALALAGNGEVARQHHALESGLVRALHDRVGDRAAPRTRRPAATAGPGASRAMSSTRLIDTVDIAKGRPAARGRARELEVAVAPGKAVEAGRADDGRQRRWRAEEPRRRVCACRRPPASAGGTSGVQRHRGCARGCARPRRRRPRSRTRSAAGAAARWRAGPRC